MTATMFNALADELRPLLPAAWKLLGYDDTMDEPDRPTVVLKLDTVQRFPAAPQGAYLTEWVATVTDPATDPAKADPSLFGELLEFLDALDQVEWALWGTAKRVLDGGRYAFDVTIQTSTTKE